MNGRRRALRPVPVLMTVALLVAAGCLLLVKRNDPRPPTRAVLTSGSPQGVYYAFATTLAAHIRAAHPTVSVTVDSSTGSIQNLQRLAEGSASCAVTASDAASVALAGDPPFKTPVPMRAVARVYDDYVQLVTRPDTSITSIDDLSGLPVSLGAGGSGVRLVATRLLAADGLPIDRVHDPALGLADSITALRTGRISAFFWSGGLPTPALSQLFATNGARLVPLGSVARALVNAFGFSYRPATVPAGTYGLPDAVDSIAVSNLLVCRADVPDQVVDELLSTLFRHQDSIARSVPPVNTMDLWAAIETEPVPLHPAALRWFRRSKP